MNGKQKDFERRKRKPGKRCLVIFRNKTSADGVSPRLFPDGESVQRQWIAFVRTKREPNSWISGSGHICRDDFSADNYQGIGEKISGFSSKPVLKNSAVPSIKASPIPGCCTMHLVLLAAVPL